MEANFDELYKTWPNQRDKAGTKLAYDFILKKHHYSELDLLKAAKLWAFQASDFQHQHQLLANWLRDEKFIEYIKTIEASGGFDKALEHAQMFRDAAVVVCGQWNRLRRNWWTTVDNIKDRSYAVEKALHNNFWQANWSRALELARNIFEYPSRDSIGNIKLIPSIEWFCDLEEQNVSKIIEGYFGKPTKKTDIPKLTRSKFSEEDWQEIKSCLMSTKDKILKIEAWQVRKTFISISLCYHNTTIEAHKMPHLKDDQEAVEADLKAKAKIFNDKGYTPDLAKQHKFSKAQQSFDEAKPKEDLSFLL